MACLRILLRPGCHLCSASRVTLSVFLLATAMVAIRGASGHYRACKYSFMTAHPGQRRCWVPDISPVRYDSCNQPNWLIECLEASWQNNFRPQHAEYELHVLRWLVSALDKAFKAQDANNFRTKVCTFRLPSYTINSQHTTSLNQAAKAEQEGCVWRCCQSFTCINC